MLLVADTIRRLGLDRSLAAEGFETQAENALCSICHDYVKEARETNCEARHVFCRPCIERVKRSSGRRGQCPTCRGEFSELAKPSVFTLNLLEQVKWKCLNFEQGCSFTGTKTNLEEHLDTECPEQETECSFKGCTEKMRRAVISQHGETCLFRLLPCEHCKDQVPFNGTETHMTTCKKFPLECPNNCGGTVPRDTLSSHVETECEEQEVECAVSGCGEKVKRREMEAHEEKNMRKHFRLIGFSLQAMQKQLQKTSTELEGTRAELQKATAQLLEAETGLPEIVESKKLKIPRGASESQVFQFKGGSFCLRVERETDRRIGFSSEAVFGVSLVIRAGISMKDSRASSRSSTRAFGRQRTSSLGTFAMEYGVASSSSVQTPSSDVRPCVSLLSVPSSSISTSPLSVKAGKSNLPDLSTMMMMSDVRG
uniref:RING-type domain-containing protein n=1 Tax=Chromera velia CCMP2878 TaxID=1169474 RepID=A0A0G4G060_9ALVE|eukprot:Cvel_536.t1-p1 / transcript=Cvel_536.t1 / gene=Cvel_536 / organism=Chromera_velia_CCMP2878 / gene_product=TNF receptor-associated factor 5, putative / transcript_product=TNF receptor-associated factor 5, putative / location=Cvel_scaffold16:204166-205851(+) / protein_length=425 / sequence_SO=supercontig / SO=protein_coding / is_pseudo=false